MPGYTLVPVDYQPDFEGYSLVPVDYDPFPEGGPVQQARTQLASQPPPDAGFDQPPSAPQPPGQDPHSQYQALRPMLGDRNAMLATVYPELRETLIAQALAGRQQPGQTSGPAPTGGVSGVNSTGADPDSTGAATAARPAATACDGISSARRQRAGDRQQPRRIGWRRWFIILEEFIARHHQRRRAGRLPFRLSPTAVSTGELWRCFPLRSGVTWRRRPWSCHLGRQCVIRSSGTRRQDHGARHRRNGGRQCR